MSTVARIVIRDSGKGEPGLGLLSLFKNQKTFEDGDVWEIEECMDEILLRKVGKTFIKTTVQHPHNSGFCWGQSIGSLLDCAGKLLYLTEEEYAQHLEKRDAERHSDSGKTEQEMV